MLCLIPEANTEGSSILLFGRLRRHLVVGCILEVLVSMWSFGGCLGADYWLVVVFQYMFVEQK